MVGITRTLTIAAAMAFAVSTFARVAEAKHHGGHHAHAKKAAALIPAHQKPGYVGLAAVPVPGLIDVGFGPVFPFGGWPK